MSYKINRFLFYLSAVLAALFFLMLTLNIYVGADGEARARHADERLGRDVRGDQRGTKGYHPTSVPSLMCGRYTFFTSAEDLEAHFEALVSVQDSILPNWNVTPGARMPVVAVGREGVPVIPVFRWGLIPSWAKEAAIGYKMINARRETLREKPAFGRLLERRRCLVPSNGYFEWKPDDRDKIPQYIHRPDRSLIAFAGLWDRWASPEGEDVFSYSIITTDADPRLSGVHHRMPVMLPKARHRDWLDNRLSAADHLDLLLETDVSDLVVTPADKRLNKPSENDAGVIGGWSDL